MNNLFIEGPIQTGKSTLIREVLQARYGPEFDNGPGGKGVGGFTVQRIQFPTRGDKKRTGFRLAPANAPIQAHTCVSSTDENLLSSDGVFKVAGPSGSRVNLEVFETRGIELLKQALDHAKADRISLVLLDEIGGHEMNCSGFMTLLEELLDSDIPCIGVIKHPESATRMDPSLREANENLHKKITGPGGEHGEILYYKRGDETVRTALNEFLG
ncbi:MAG: nucleoside-triphosphatase [Eubacteriales bacterium]|nr:nucleoside-triphosphatase [Eubacteriales bacterium]